jgi:hypothetical protein
MNVASPHFKNFSPICPSELIPALDRVPLSEKNPKISSTDAPQLLHDGVTADKTIVN